ncbi:MAG: hypothetical protein KGI04_03455 [Candidatus Micrarchaeota archaeon]|nr:hypothetical protein [Candidatus Micrarchaeota archaeon]
MASNPENLNFLDLACLFKIEKDTTLERFGSVINASVFDAANITGSLKQKGLIDFTAYYPGPNSIVITEAGTKLKADADAKSAESLDNLDEEILRQMSGGKRYPTELQSTLNVRSKDLAFRIYKLFKQNFLSYELKNGNVELMLTEQGFLKAKPVIQAVQVPKPQPKQQMQAMGHQAAPQQAQTAAQQPGNNTQDAEQMVKEIKLHGKPRRGLWIGIVVVIVVAAAAYYLYAAGMLPAI